MVANCANPKCRARFHYWGEGRVFSFDHAAGRNGHAAADGWFAPESAIEYFWLCGECSADYTLAVDAATRQVTVVPKQAPGAAMLGRWPAVASVLCAALTSAETIAAYL